MTPEKTMARAEAASEAEDWAEAVRLWRELIQEFADVPPKTFVRLSRAHRARLEFAEAEAAVNERWRIHPDVELAIERAEISMGQKDWAEAMRRWQVMIDALGADAPEGALRRLARAREGLAIDHAEDAMKQGEWAEAIRRWRTALEESGKEAPHGVRQRLRDAQVAAATERAELAMKQGNYLDAIQFWDELLEEFGEDAPAGVYQRLSRCNRAVEAFAAAGEVIARGRLLHPLDKTLAIESAELAMAKGDWADAVKRWRALLDQHEDTASARSLRQLHMALRWQGQQAEADRVFAEYLTRTANTDYAEWITRNDTLSDRDRSLIRRHMASFPARPTLSLLMVVRDTLDDNFERTFDSVQGQLYEKWELCIGYDASISNETKTTLEGHADDDSRIRCVPCPVPGSSSACANAALELASGAWVAAIETGDTLAPHALYLVAEAAITNPGAAIIYGDEDLIDGDERRHGPYFKPDWDYDLLLSQSYLGHMTACRADLARQAAGFREDLDGSHDWDLALRILDAAPNRDVHHIPHVLHHRREAKGSSPLDSSGRAVPAAQRAVTDHLNRTAQAAAARRLPDSSQLRIIWDLPTVPPLVSIVIPTKDRYDLLRTCIDGVLNRTDYVPIEVIIVDNGSTEPDACAFLADLRSHPDVTVVVDRWEFNFASLVNEGVAVSSGEVCLLLNNDIDVIHPDWLTEMVSQALRPKVGAVGAKLYYENDTVQHAGVVLGLGGVVAGHAHRFFPRGAPGYANQLATVHGSSAVTAACLATRRDVYDEVGGFNEEDLPISFNDVDFCLRVREAGYRVIWTPHAELYHFESISRQDTNLIQHPAMRTARQRADRYMWQRWGPSLGNDPFYNPNLDLSTETFGRAEASRAHRPWLGLADDRRDLRDNPE